MLGSRRSEGGSMSQGFTPEFLEELKYKSDIVQVISSYVPLVRKGGKYFGNCPFHHEKTGSFCVNQQEGYYHCFGCGASGDLIRFVMEIESISFYDAVKYLADKAGLPLPEVKMDPDFAKKKERREVLKQLMRDAAAYYHANLMHPERGSAAREYLLSRGLGEDVWKRYGLGLSLDFDSLPAYLRRKGYSLKDLVECGMIPAENHPSDSFGGRVIVPIINSMGEVVAFGGRIYRGEKDVAKYKNSTNTLLFDKSRTLYGLNYVKRDRKEGRGSDFLILVEGYMDVIALGATGVTNAVAGMGTALTEGQARELGRMTSRLYVCYDGDGAGQKATVKNLDVLLAAGLDVKVVTLDEGMDPDETVRAVGKEGFLKKLDEALPAIEYKLKLCEDACDLRSLTGRAKYAQLAMRVIAPISDPAQRAVYRDMVASKSKLSPEQLELPETVRPEERQMEPERASKVTRAARIVLNRLLAGAEYCDAGQIRREWFAYSQHAKIFDVALEKGKAFNAGTAYSYVDDDKELGRILGVSIEGDAATEKRIYTDCLFTLANDYISRRLDELKLRYASLTDPEEKKMVVQEILEMQKKLKSKILSDKY